MTAMRSTFRHPSAWMPMAMSGLALLTLAIAFATSGLARQADEGAAAHIWQLLMAGQVPVILFFAFQWVPVSPRPALVVLAVQLTLALAAAAPVYLLHL